MKLREFMKIGWMVGDVAVKLWPFVAFAIFVAGLAAYDYFLA